MKVAVVGCGYVGLMTAVGLSSKGHQVLAVDIDPLRIEQIRQGIVPFYEPGMAKALRTCLKRGDLQVSNLLDDVVDYEVILICVQTPPKKNGAINLKILEKAAKSLASVFAQNPMKRTVVIRSTVIPGTTDKFATPIFQAVSAKTHIAFNPEFLREGSAFDDFVNPDRIVIGTHSAYAGKQLKRLYTPFSAPVIVTTPTTAELAKYASNTFLTTLISFSNEIARLCEHTEDTDVEDVLNIVHHDRRFTPVSNSKARLGLLSYLKAGCGFGGSCFPKDLSALIAFAKSKGVRPHLLKAVAIINTSQPIRLVKMVSEILGNLTKRNITVLGVAFKGGTDDLRESPGLRIVDELLKRGANITIYDPLVREGNLTSYSDQGVIIAPTLKSAVEGADICIIASNASEFKKLKVFKQPSKKKTIIVDGRRILKIPKSSEAMIDYYAIGLPKERIYKS